MAWTLEGQVMEHCNCNSVCPCFTSNLAAPGDNERCRGFIAIHIDSGTGDAEDLAGKNVVFLQDAPGQMAEGGWRVGIIVDESADDDQARRLAGLVNGEMGGPFAAFTPLFGEIVGVERAPVEFKANNGKHTLRAGNMIDAELADMVHEGMNAPVQLVNAGVPFGPPVNISPPTRSIIKAFGMDLDNSGRHGTTSRISWSG